MNREYRIAADKAQRKLLTTVADTDKRIADIYATAGADLASEAGKQKDGSLTKRWQLEMSKSLNQRVKQMNREVASTIVTSAKSSAETAVNVQVSWLDQVLSRALGGDTGGKSFVDMFARTSDEALRSVVTGQAYLDGKGLSKRIWNGTGRLKGGIQDLIEQAIAQKRSAIQLARDLERYLNPKALEDTLWNKVYPGIPFPLHVDAHAQLLARTSINQAYHIAGKEAAALNPFATAIHWALSPSHFERQVLPFGTDICDEYATHDEGLGVGNWPINKVPLPHPNCLCYQHAVVPESLDHYADTLRAWLDGESNPDLDAAFAQWRDRAISGDDTPQVTDHKAGERRAQLLTQISGQPWMQAMSVSEREAVYARLNNASEAELRRILKNGL